MASGPAAGFSSASLAAIKAPFVVDTAAADEVLPPAAHSAQLARGIAGARSVVRPVGHFAYVPECKPVIGRLLARAAGVPICDEAPGVDRAVLHERVAADVLAFFGAQLKAAPQ
jgi:predicted dienelactone hydrolase